MGTISRAFFLDFKRFLKSFRVEVGLKCSGLDVGMVQDPLLQHEGGPEGVLRVTPEQHRFSAYED